MAAVDDPAEYVPAQLVNAERMSETGRRQRQAGAHLGVAVGRPEGASDCNNNMQE